MSDGSERIGAICNVKLKSLLAGNSNWNPSPKSFLKGLFKCFRVIYCVRFDWFLRAFRGGFVESTLGTGIKRCLQILHWRDTTRRVTKSHLDSKSRGISPSQSYFQPKYSNVNAVNPYLEVCLRSIQRAWSSPCPPQSKWLEMHRSHRFGPETSNKHSSVHMKASAFVSNLTLSPLLSVMNFSSDSMPFRIMETFSSSPGESVIKKRDD